MFFIRKKRRPVPVNIPTPLTSRKRRGRVFRRLRRGKIIARRPEIIERSEKLTPSGIIRRAKQALVTLFLILTVAATLWIIFLSPLFLVRSVTLIGSETVTEKQALVALNDVLSENVLFILPKRHLLFAPSADIETALLEKFPQFTEVSLRKVFPSTLRVTAMEKKPVALWYTAGQYYLMDERGTIYANILDLPSQLTDTFPIIQDRSGERVVRGDQVIEQEFATFITETSDYFDSKLEIRLAAFNTPSPESDELVVTTAEGWKVYFDAARSAEAQVDKLKRVLDETIDQEHREKLEYVDLRVKNRVYYK